MIALRVEWRLALHESERDRVLHCVPRLTDDIGAWLVTPISLHPRLELCVQTGRRQYQSCIDHTRASDVGRPHTWIIRLLRGHPAPAMFAVITSPIGTTSIERDDRHAVARKSIHMIEDAGRASSDEGVRDGRFTAVRSLCPVAPVVRPSSGIRARV